MTKKQYKKKTMQERRALGLKNSDRVPVPKWGMPIPNGLHKGEKLISYAQAWNYFREVMNLE